MSVLSAPYFHDEEAAYAKLESIVWPNGPVCPHCGGVERIGKLKGSATRIGVHKCYQCRKQFTVKVGTVFESSHVPLYKWFQACYLLCSSKKGISSHQLHRVLEVTYKTAWFMTHRLREAMKTLGFEPMGGEGATVEADETYFGEKEVKTSKGKRGPANKRCVVALVERGGNVRSFHVDRATKQGVSEILKANVDPATHLNTDESRLYKEVGQEFAGHDTVNHSAKEYVRGNAYTNTIEGYFSIFKRGMKGIYQHCAEKHLHRYLAEFDFRYNERKVDDSERTEAALKGIVGKRLTYRRSNQEQGIVCRA